MGNAPLGGRHSKDLTILPSTDIIASPLRIAVAQTSPGIGALEANADEIRRCAERAAGAGAQLLVTPELSVCGYTPEDLLLRRGFLARCATQVQRLAEDLPLPTLIGVPLERRQGGAFNAALLVSGGQVRVAYAKRFLPNYGIFDELRTFAAGEENVVVDLGGARIGLSICEDLWVPDGPARDLADDGVEVIVNMSASPYARGLARMREQMLRTRARDGRVAVVYANQVGGHDEVVFDGRSVVIDCDGRIIARAKSFERDLLIVDLDCTASRGQRLRDARVRPRTSVSIPIHEVRIAAPAPSDRPQPARVEDLHRGPDPEMSDLWAALCLATRDFVARNGLRDVVLGMSGGIDSALVAALASEALGAAHVHAVSLPSRHSSHETRSDAEVASALLGIDFREIPIEDLHIDAEQALGEVSGTTAENLQARLRMVVLMGLSNRESWLLLATGNKSEIAAGYCTLYGDTAGGFAPLKDVYKSDVFRLARWLNTRGEGPRIPESIIERPPSAELAPGQRDDHSLPDYAVLDRILEAYLESHRDPDEVAAAGVAPPALVAEICARVDAAEFKRRQGPPGPRLGPVPFGRGRRMPIARRPLSLS